MGRYVKARETWVEDLRSRYGEEFIDDLKRVRQQPFFNTPQIAAKYGITRQYVSLVLKKMYSLSQDQMRRCKIKQIIEEKSCECLYDPRSRVENDEIDSNMEKNNFAQRKFWEQCQKRSLGIKVLQKNLFLVGERHRIIVKGVYKLSSLKRSLYYRQYVHNLSKRVDNFDFLAIFVCPDDVFWLIPKEKLRKSNSIYLRPLDKSLLKIYTPYNKKREEQFCERWDLLLNGEK
jgi:hypothetical protein